LAAARDCVIQHTNDRALRWPYFEHKTDLFIKQRLCFGLTDDALRHNEFKLDEQDEDDSDEDAHNFNAANPFSVQPVQPNP
jgi:hypothetical protein